MQLNTESTENWLVDLGNLTCYNTEYKIIIAFEKRGTALVGKIRDIPIDLAEKWAKEPDGQRLVRKAFIEADEIFFHAYFNQEIERR
jgi:hypothetical protein